MITIDIEKNTINSMIQLMEQDIEKFQKKIKPHLTKVKNRLYQHLLSFTPVKTGYLKSRWKNGSIRKDTRFGIKEWTVTISNDTYYLLFVNDGHFTKNGTYINGQYFIERALRLMKYELKELILF